MIINRHIVHAIFAFSLLLLPVPGYSGDNNKLKQMRSIYLDAERAQHKNRRKYQVLLKKLRNYPLYPYLRYKDIQPRLRYIKQKEVTTFLDAFPDSPLSNRLRYRWLLTLAKKKSWDKYLEFYKDIGIKSLQCYRLQALISTGQNKQASENIEKIWLTGKSLPKSCDRVISYWNQNKLLSADIVWKRIQLSMKSGRTRLAVYLARFLPKSDRPWVSLWRKVHRSPSTVYKFKKLRKKHKIARNIIMHGLQRMTRTDPVRVANSFLKINKTFQLTEDEQASLIKSVALRLAYRNKPAAQDWLEKIKPENETKRTREWRIRLALIKHDWESVIRMVDKLDPEEGSSNRWRYWQARALEASGREKEADSIYTSLASKRSYEGFLSADKLGLPYVFEDQKLVFSIIKLAEMESRPGISRARELFYLGKHLNARREWYYTTKDFNDIESQIAAKLAHDWGWHDQAIITLSSSSFRNDLKLRFPIIHKDIIYNLTKKSRIEPAWILALIRRESAFNKDARSNRNAYGLMQLLPRTARQIARSISARMKKSTDLLKVNLNIRLGIAYLKKVLGRFNHPVLATAAYNAGPHRVKKWLPVKKALDADIWIETIPFTETRNYLQSVLAYTVIYEKRLGKIPTPLKKRMPAITPLSKTKPSLNTTRKITFLDDTSIIKQQ